LHREQLKQGGLASPALSNDCKNLFLAHLEADLIHYFLSF
jgi:hypothetical protein